MHSQEVEKWISSSLKDTMSGFIKSNALERALEKEIVEILKVGIERLTWKRQVQV
jgi:hypothetical protein